ncbi:AMP-binding protein [Streptomyces sp. RFCAC02]|uniref:AMP-binding protein n=1 Tax=Streptomyces sp. RFCAC02 TaxID=2499143 RepID=UPI0010205EEF|nr:AMP-binding protein [Streptomyces sp. RFCAC02]
MDPLLPTLSAAVPPDRPAVRFGATTLTHAGLAAAARALAAELDPARRVAVWAAPEPATAVAVAAALLAGVAAVPLNPRSGEAELGHILADSDPAAVLVPPGTGLPAPVAALPRVEVDVHRAMTQAPPEPPEESPALVVYTSGTTGPPKGAVIPRRAIRATLDALADAWGWTDADVLVHGLPLFHVHGLILGVLGPLRHGGAVRHLGRFSPGAAAEALADGGTMLFGVPTMYHRIAEALPGDARLAAALAGARLLVSGSAALPAPDREAIHRATGRRVVERYGMTETLMNTSVRPGDPDPDGAAGTVGTPLAGVTLRLVDDDGAELPPGDPDAIGEIQLRGPNLFSGYLNRPDATGAAFAPGGWFRTGDMATLDAAGRVRIVGRRATDLIKSGGYKIGAGEIENALLDHPAVREAAVTGEPDPDLGERIVAWIVPADPAAPPAADAIAGHVAALLAPHKRPRVVRCLTALPRNDMGKIMKRALHD